jgi:hypothetical protein
MKIRYKLYFLAMMYIIGLVFTTTFSIYGISRVMQIQETIHLGERLQVRSAEVQSLMKDIVFDLFAPKMYGQTRSLTYSPRSAVTIRQWQKAVMEYDEAFKQFMKQDFFIGLRDEFTRDQYLVALRMNDRAMAMLSEMEETLHVLRESYRNVDNLYNEMQKEDSLVPFFRQFQETSYYFSNSFEGFMRYFIVSLQANGNNVQRRITLLFLISLGFIILGFILITVFLMRGMDRQITLLQKRFREVSRGNFSLVKDSFRNDEFGELSRTFDTLVFELKTNIESFLRLTRDIGTSMNIKTGVKELLDLVVQSVVIDTATDTSLITRKKDGEFPELSAQAGAELNNNDILLLKKELRSLSSMTVRPGSFNQLNCSSQDGYSHDFSMLVFPLTVKEGLFGNLIAIKGEPDNQFSDLGITRLATFAEFASLSIDNFFSYKELIERREAQYQALSSQVQPHFINNVLNGFMGLNRKGDRDGLDKAIISLREMLRYVQNRKPWATLAEEIEFLDRYCTLQKIRFGDRLEYHFDIDADCTYIQIPRLILQPVVENAIIHGLEPAEWKGNLTITAAPVRRFGEVHADIRILDNGVGFDAGTMNQCSQIGTLNVKQRLESACPDHIFTIESTPGKGTEVHLRI